jgi:hypothetical protein
MRRFPSERECEVSRTATEIEDAGIRISKDRAKSFCNAPPPYFVDIERKKVIQKVISRGDASEHFADMGGGLGFVVRAFRARAR